MEFLKSHKDEIVAEIKGAGIRVEGEKFYGRLGRLGHLGIKKKLKTERDPKNDGLTLRYTQQPHT
jgi:hypothetical protein